MAKKINSNKQSTLPSNEMKCVWMTAGVVSYKLCDYEYDCEKCPYDLTIRHKTSIDEINKSEEFDRKIGDLDIDNSERAKKLITDLLRINFVSNVYYSSNHLYVSKENKHIYKIGIDNIGAKLLPHIGSVVLIPVNDSIKKGQIFCWLVLHGVTLALISPISGKIREHNPNIYNSPNLIRMNNFEGGWILKIEPSDEREIRELYFGKETKEWHKNELKRINNLFKLLIERNKNVNTLTMYDGGTFISSLSQLVPVEDYFEILKSVLMPINVTK